MTKEQFIKLANEVHSDAYDYSNSEFTGVTHRLSITCEKHGDFYVTPNAHINYKVGCEKCSFQEEVEEVQKDLEPEEKTIYAMDAFTFDELFNK